MSVIGSPSFPLSSYTAYLIPIDTISPELHHLSSALVRPLVSRITLQEGGREEKRLYLRGALASEIVGRARLCLGARDSVHLLCTCFVSGGKAKRQEEEASSRQLSINTKST